MYGMGCVRYYNQSGVWNIKHDFYLLNIEHYVITTM